uniref:CRB1m n=1 Tax=Volvox carteri f. nagariensis TaxID=3068 RepID=D9CJ68_VOLCA|nr:CRB1m [Volvox carteri f. nagariensis]
MSEEYCTTALVPELEGQGRKQFTFGNKTEQLGGCETSGTAETSSVAEAILDAGRNRALELASLFAAQAGQAIGIHAEGMKRKRDDGASLEAPDLKRPAGDVASLKLADDIPLAASFVAPGTESIASETLSCPTDKVGRIIGRAGATIRELEASTNTRIQVDHKALGDKPVIISGRRDDVENAKRVVQDLICGSNEAVPPGTGEVQETVECPPGIVGRVIGRGGETIRTLQQASGAHILVNQDFPDGVPRQIVITGAQDAVQRATSMVSELIQGDQGNTQSIIQRFGVGSTEVVECPKAMVGRVIGKGGETIKDLQKRFSASIQIDQGSTPCKITITGPAQTVSSARRAIEDLIRAATVQPSGGTRSAPPYNTSYAHQPFNGNGPSGAYGPYGGYNLPPTAYTAPSGYPPYGGYPPYPTTGTPYGAYASFGGAADPFTSGSSLSHQHYATSGIPQQNVAPAQQLASLGSIWQVLQDDQGRSYYYNTQTGVSQWEKPVDLP